MASEQPETHLEDYKLNGQRFHSMMNIQANMRLLRDELGD